MTLLGALFEPGRIGRLRPRNRIVLPGMATTLADETGAAGDRLIDYYAARARGGAALVVVESSSVDSPLGDLKLIQMRIDSDLFIRGLNRLAEAIQSNGALAAIQLNHGGRLSPLSATRGQQPVSASSGKCFPPVGSARELSVEEIGKLVEAFANAAVRAKIAGFDAVELHAAHGYLISQFLSPLWNRRTDDYGGTVANRARFLLEIVRAVGQRAGLDYPILVRLTADDFLAGGFALPEAVQVARMLEDAGVAAIDVSAGTPEGGGTVEPMAVPPGHLVAYAESVKKAVGIPVIAVGRINDPFEAERILEEGKADFVAVARGLLADPELPNKARQGRTSEIRHCIACNDACLPRRVAGFAIKCVVNPAAGAERTWDLAPVARARNVLVVGGGPAGMEAARIASLRGHSVTLWERSGELGGQMLLSTVNRHKREMRQLLDHLRSELSRLGVEVALGVTAAPENVLRAGSDVVIVATGAIPVSPRIPGSDQDAVLQAWDCLGGRRSPGQRVIVAGGGLVGCETAEFLVDRGHSVTIVEVLADCAGDLEPRSRQLLKARLAERKVEVLTNTRIEEITAIGVIVAGGGERQTLAADTVVLALGAAPRNELLQALDGKVPELCGVGDCLSPRKLQNAIHEGAYAGLRA